MNEIITIVIVDDHEIVRDGLRMLLEKQKDFRVVGEAAEGVSSVRLIEKLKPRILLLDLVMPGFDGLEVMRHVRMRSPKTSVLILSMHCAEEKIAAAMVAGASGYILKASISAEIIPAIRKVISGRTYISPSISNEILQSCIQHSKEKPFDRIESLTTREREVLSLAVEGRPSSEIGRLLFISPRTVEIHRANLMKKLGCRNRTELVRYAIKCKFVTHPS